jgi:hypothetical protein
MCDGILLGIVSIEMVLISVIGKQCEPGGVRFADGSTDGMLVHVAHDEVFNIIAQVGFMNSHRKIIAQCNQQDLLIVLTTIPTLF